ncbi:MAG: hypothetical protein ACRD3W_31705, partial [Terriglobales bacterium]
MKRRLILPGFAIAALLLFGFAGTAHATNYDCDGGSNPVPTNPPGDALISASGSCTISHAITAGGYIEINAGGDIQTKDLTANNSFILLNTGGGLIKVDGDITARGRSVVLYAAHDIAVNNVNIGATDQGSSVRFFANMTAGSSTTTDPFIIGESSNNGVLSIDVSTVTGGGTASSTTNHGFTIKNYGTGGIDYKSSSAVNLVATQSRGSAVLMDAGDGGTVT